MAVKTITGGEGELKVRYTITVNNRQIEMLIKAIEQFKRDNPGINVNVDYNGLKGELGPLERYMRRVKKND